MQKEGQLPISCFLNTVHDSLDGILSTWGENVWLASNGGGIGTYWGEVDQLRDSQEIWTNSGIIPFVRVMDSLTLAISQGFSQKRFSSMLSRHSSSEIEEFLEIRKPSGGF